MSDKVQMAIAFATAAHAAVGQVRKYTDEPYIVHPIEVMEMVKNFDHTEDMLVAAVLHDVVEDTEITLELVQSMFGDNVADLVFWLTDASKPEDGNRNTRKAIDRAHIAKAPREAQTIKLCDVCSNISSIVEHDTDFAVVYLKEKEKLLEVIKRADQNAISHARNTLAEMNKKLKEVTNV